jgi:DNA-binding MarR family transcriptional regulator
VTEMQKVLSALGHSGNVAMAGVYSLREHDLDNLNVLLNVLDIFRDVRSTMPLQYVVTFLAVAADEGKPVGEYARKLNVVPSVMSRHLLDIGPRNRHMKEGFGLVVGRPNPMNLREHEYYLSPQGHALLQRVLRNMTTRKP